MLSRTRTFALLAVVSGLVAGLLVLFVLVQNSRARAQVVEETRHRLGQQMTLFVPARNIDANQIIEEKDVTEREFFQVDLPEGANLARRPEDVVGRVANVPLFAGEPIYIEKLGGSFKPVSALVPTGLVAFAMPISPDYAAGALISPGDVIDIIRVASGASFSATPEATTVLFEKVEVLGIAGQYPFGGTISAPAADTETSVAGFGSAGNRGVQDEDPVRDKILLLKLSPDQAVKLADAMENSRLYIALHSRER